MEWRLSWVGVEMESGVELELDNLDFEFWDVGLNITQSLDLGLGMGT